MLIKLFTFLAKKKKLFNLDSRFHGNDNFNGNPVVEPLGILFRLKAYVQ